MKNIEKDKLSAFENEWQQAFEDAEMAPGKDIWNNIDAHLANKETDKYKRKIVYYRWMAAASVLFAIGLSYFSLDHAFNNQMATEETSPVLPEAVETVAPENEIAKGTEDIEFASPDVMDERPDADLAFSENEGAGNSGSNPDPDNTTDKLAHTEIKNGDDGTPGPDESALAEDGAAGTPKPAKVDNLAQTSPVEDNTVAPYSGLDESQRGKDAPLNDEGDAVPKGKEYYNESTHNALLVDGSKSEDVQVATPEPVLAESDLNSVQGYAHNDKLHATLMEAPYIYSIPGVAMIRSHENEDEKATRLWAGLNVGSSLFDPNFQEGSNFQPKTSPALANYTMSDEARVLPQEASYNESTDPGISYSLGVNFGLRLTEKWVIQSGIAYAHRTSSTNSTTYVQNVRNEIETPGNFGNVSTEADRNVLNSLTQDYQISNSFQFASVPLKAGYLLVDRKFGVMLLAGVSADFFLSNTMSESDEKIDEVKVEAGSDSPFKDVNFNGVIGAEFSYKLSRNYHLTLEPNYGIALSSFTKSGSSFTSNPQTFGIAAGLKFYWK